MSDRPAKTARRRKDDPAKQRVRLSRSTRQHIRRLKAAGRPDEAMAIQRAELDRKKAAAQE